jgi:hypothetical protein
VAKKLLFMSSKDQLADGLTKPITVQQLQQFWHNLKLGEV